MSRAMCVGVSFLIYLKVKVWTNFEFLYSIGKGKLGFFFIKVRFEYFYHIPFVRIKKDNFFFLFNENEIFFSYFVIYLDNSLKA
jgi:hypothetical protein